MSGLGPWLAARSGWLRITVFAVLGALAALGQAPFDLWPITLVALAVALAMVPAAKTAWQAALWGWALGGGYFALALNWIIEPFFVQPEIYGWMAPFALFFMALGAGLFWAIAFGITRRFIGPGILGAALGLAILEYTRSVIFTGFPWALLGHIWIDTPLLQLASVIGPHGLTVVTLAGAVLLAQVRFSLGWVVQTGAVVIGIGLAWGLTTTTTAHTARLDGPVIRLIQPNAPQDQKWDPELAPMFFERQLSFTNALSETGIAPDLIVWPETSVPYFLEYSGTALEEIGEAAQGVPVIVGIQRLEEPRYYNSLVMLGRGGQVQNIYDKTHLVPFGEYVPFADLLGQFGIHGLAANEGGGFSAGAKGPRGQMSVLSVPNVGNALPMICYEGIFAQEVNNWDTRPEFLLMITNDAWFGEFVGPFQHLAQARLRAVEQGLPMIRVANTGVSALIDPHGVIRDHIPLGQAGWIDVVLPAPAPLTIYARFGDKPALLLIGLLCCAVLVRRRMIIDPRAPAA